MCECNKDNTSNNEMSSGNVDEKIKANFLADDLISVIKQDKKKSFIIVIVLIMILFITNVFWIWQLTQFDFHSETITIERDIKQDSQGGAMNDLNNSVNIKNRE